MKNKLDNINDIIIAQEFDSGGILDRAKDVVEKSSEKNTLVSDIIVGSRHKKKCKSKTRRK
jgi:hypothetical protein